MPRNAAKSLHILRLGKERQCQSGEQREEEEEGGAVGRTE